MLSPATTPEARWVTAYAFDKLQVALGRPQAYGTQRLSQAGQLCFYPVNATTTDAERAAWGAPTLKASLEAFLAEVGRTDVSPRLARVLTAAFLTVLVGVAAAEIRRDVTGPSRSAWRELASAVISTDITRSLPALSNGKFFFRDNGSRGGRLMCLQLSSD